MDYFLKLQDLLKIERTEDRDAYLKLTQSASVSDRRAAGLCWYPIAIGQTEPSRGDYINVEIERKSHLDIVHQLQFGKPAVLFSNHDPSYRVEGIISYQNGDRLKINLFTEELPDWSRDGKLGVELLFDNNSYDDMQSALKQAAAAKNNPLVEVLTGNKSPVFNNIDAVAINSLNPGQQSAVNKILAAQQLAIVHGPPGTGKTTTLVQAIKLIAANERLLVVAPSNAAVDLLSEKLSNEGLNVLRIGNPARVSEKLLSLTLDSQMAQHSYMKDSKKLKKQAAEYKNMAHKYKRSFGRAEREQRKALFNEAHSLMREVAKAEEFIIDDIVSKAQVITATLAGANHWTIKNLKFQTVIIDEAGQALEPACWIPIMKAQKVVFAGDHQQLPPTIKSDVAARGGLSTTLMEKCVALYPEAVVLLEEQYRMNSLIMDFSSREFYGNALKAHPSVANGLLFEGDLPFTFIDTAGCGFDEKPAHTSTINPEEATFVHQFCEKFRDGLPHFSIAVISPYREQIRLLKELFPHNDPQLSVNTIDSFQGQERDMVVISMTRSNNEGTIGFLADIRRMNVAMTRAKKKLVIIGDSATIGRFPFYADMIKYAEEIGGYKSAWEFIAD
ncbi:AAA domain-containing protein [Mucilaginibacter sp. X4EP1]|uniref:AAA domain-containing protein n=1 Tax=Mucilaginibacter sp. X4EP1 TaxID=2723092 RepID=UPI0021697508|nr:AAA domain-containing protein [Mucilaginibacter sp. X4EP1]MCS3813338.1 superfamily I DNA and/or RNA helicase [Mucilaginibacter sp. X4EP1]